MNTCYIIGAGEFFGSFSPDDTDFVIAADGGYNTLISHGIRCDLLIGDMDSITAVPSDVQLMRFPVEKDQTDSFLAYFEGVKRGYETFAIYGGVGGRDDHTYANYSLLIYAKRKGHRAFLYGKDTVSLAIKDEAVTLTSQRGETFSVFSISPSAQGVSITGAKYECSNITLTQDFPLGVSNSHLNSSTEISVKDGELLIMTGANTNFSFTH